MAEWIDLLDPTGEELDARLPRQLHDQALEQLLKAPVHDDEPRPKLESHGSYLYGVFIVPVCRRRKDKVYYQEIDLVATSELVVTVRKAPPDDRPFEFDQVQEELAGETDPAAGLIVATIVDEVAEAFLKVVDELDDEIDELEDRVEKSDPQEVRGRIADLRRDLLHIRRALGPTRDALDRVADRRIDLGEAQLIDEHIALHFRDAYDKLLRATDGLELSRDLLAGVRDYLQAKVSNDQNEVMKKLTAIASILLVPTFIVGVYGQNFKHHFPELNWQWGYVWSWGLIVLSTVGQLIFFRRKGWF